MTHTPAPAFAHSLGPRDARVALVGEAAYLSFKIIELTQGYKAIVSPEDYNFLAQFKWYADVGQWTVYVKTDHSPFGRIRMHQMIMQAPYKQIIHHKNQNGLHNYRSNLEVLTQAEHCRLSSLRKTKATAKFRGVYLHRTGKYAAEITVNYKKRYLGLYSRQEDAAEAYNRASRELFGENAIVNELTQ